MRFVTDAGLWTTGPEPDALPLTALLEVSGAVLSWTVDDPDAEAAIAFTEPARAEWLWRVVGEHGHGAIVSALADASLDAVEVEGVAVRRGSLDPLRRLAVGHWLRRWWPASRRDGIAELDGAILDAELALLTVAAEDYFADETLDADVGGLLRPHARVLAGLARLGDPRVGELVGSCAELADDLGFGFAAPTPVPQQARRDDYALAAGVDGVRGAGADIAGGVASVHWAAVPPGVFDAAEDTVSWRVGSDGALARAVVQAELSGSGSPVGIPVRVTSGVIAGAGELDGSGAATLALGDQDGIPVTETVAWNHDWQHTSVTVGVDVAESPEVRARVRVFARQRLQRPGAGAFLAELLAAETDY